MSSFSLPEASSRTILPATVVIASIAVLAVSVTAGFSLRIAAGAVVLVTLVAWVRPVYIGWHRLLAGLILVILFIPIRRYTLPGNLPFQLEPYRLLVVVLLVGWVASLLVDRRTRSARPASKGPLLLIFAGIVGSIVTNPDRVEQMSSAVQNELMFFLSFVLVLYLTASVVRRLDTIDYLVDDARRRRRGRRASSRSSRLAPASTSSTTSTASCPFLQPERKASPEAFRSTAPRGCACSAPRSTRSRSARPS